MNREIVNRRLLVDLEIQTTDIDPLGNNVVAGIQYDLGQVFSEWLKPNVGLKQASTAWDSSRDRCESCAYFRPMGLVDPGAIGSCALSSSGVEAPMQAVSLRPQSAWENDPATLRTHREFGCVAWKAKP